MYNGYKLFTILTPTRNNYLVILLLELQLLKDITHKDINQTIQKYHK